MKFQLHSTELQKKKIAKKKKKLVIILYNEKYENTLYLSQYTTRSRAHISQTVTTDEFLLLGNGLIATSTNLSFFSIPP